MVDRILSMSIQNRWLIVMVAIGLVALGLNAAARLPIDAVPDVTTNQVQINTVTPALSPLEVERFVTVPIELTLSSLPRKEEIRSLSKFGLSQVTITFDDQTDIYWARQQVLERLLKAQELLPDGALPQMAPVSTGLGEIFQFTVEATEGWKNHYSLTDLRTILDWQIKRQLLPIEGVIEVNTFGGLEKQYEVLLDPSRLLSYGITLPQVFEALRRNNQNVGGAYLLQGGEQILLRGVGLVQSPTDIGNIVVTSNHHQPIFLKDIARIGYGAQIRQGAFTKDGKGESVAGIVMMLKGANSRTVVEKVKETLPTIQKSLPEGVVINPYYDRAELVNKTIHTAVKNLVEGGLLVIVLLFLFLLQMQAGLIVSSVIPLSMLFAVIGMNYLAIPASLMSLGAIDFGLIVDAAVIIVENCVRRLAEARRRLGRRLTDAERHRIIYDASIEVRKASQFGELIIMSAYIPILTLAGIEGKMFKPMAMTVILALTGALVLSLTVVPALCALFLREPEVHRPSLLSFLWRKRATNDQSAVLTDEENPLVEWIKKGYEPVLRKALERPGVTFGLAGAFVVGCLTIFPFLGAEFLPELDEGALVVHSVRLPSASLNETIRQSLHIERILKRFPEVETVVSRIGRPEIATDPMGTEMADHIIILKPRSEWKTAKTREALVDRMAAALNKLPGIVFSWSQPIKFRMMELIEGIGSRSDVVIKIFGDDVGTLKRLAEQAAGIVSKVKGAADVRVEQVTGLPTLNIRIDRDTIARYGLNVSDVQELIQTAIAGTTVGRVIEGEKWFDLVVRLMPEYRRDSEQIGNLTVIAPTGERLPLSHLAAITIIHGPAQISRENGRRRITVEVNVRGRDIGSFVDEAKVLIEREMRLPTGTTMTWSGMFEHLESGRKRLMVAVPITFAIVFLLLFMTFGTMRHAVVVFVGIPFAITGGLLSLLIRGMPFSMSAGIGFIAVSGVAVLNGVVMVTFINQLRQQGKPLTDAIIEGAKTRLRPVLMTASVASIGFLPMALSTGTGAEVQRPLATVVIGGVVTSTVLTLLVLPVFYRWLEERRRGNEPSAGVV
ncbi:MAG: CusA/CzcA family heavy metal efflux RND transporter [Armatimonadetes bacterium]|nr:CusA/CzcA family heavy metal efflux RND transporter [Armatimonadota bacterium]MDW8122006.1 CusA/CzcA family heavy metal efflux RND transporter [Armatimonadota bacterium]